MSKEFNINSLPQIPSAVKLAEGLHYVRVLGPKPAPGVVSTALCGVRVAFQEPDNLDAAQSGGICPSCRNICQRIPADNTLHLVGDVPR